MSESEKRELGGLARSIDALFSQARPTTPVDAPEQDLVEPPPPQHLEEGAFPGEIVGDRVDVAATEAVDVEPDPFDAYADLAGDVEAEAEPEPVVEPEPSLSFADVDVPQDVVWEALEAEEPAEAVLEAEAPLPEDLEGPPSEEAAAAATAAVEAEEAEGPPSEPELPEGAPAKHTEEPSGRTLAEAVETYLAGRQAAAHDVREAAASLQERLALDPLADAVEALVHSGGDDPAPDALELALEVINPAVASRLVQRMGHEDDDERRAGYVILSQRLGTVMAKAFRGALTDATDPRARRAFYDALIAMGDTSRPMIEEMVEDDNRFLVLNAVAILGEVGGERAVELVTSALANTDGRVRREALNSLAKLGGDEAGQLVVGFLEDSEAEVRAAAAEAAGALKVERALRPMLTLLDDEDEPEVLVQVLRGLGRLGDPGAVPAIEKRAVGTLFSKPPTEVRVAAYRALHEIGSPHAKDLIEKAREDKDPVVRTTTRGLASSG
jgi:hypothetical protein